MAGARKLQAEIDRTLKRVDEGLVAFDDLYEQQRGADGQTQKLKYEEDLKKEIKKLQKLREQVKTWAAGGEIKNKQPLLDARHKIEERMEAFKVVERETKTKAYSKEGLMRDQPMTPDEKKRLKSRDWVQEIVTKLADEVDLIEAELEAMENVEGGKPKLKKGEKDPAAVLEGIVKNHKFHIDKLEALTRLLDNAAVDADAVDGLKDDLDYYVTSAREPDYEIDLELYAEFDLIAEEEEEEEDGDAGDDDEDEEGRAVKAAAAKTKAAALAAAATPSPVAAPEAKAVVKPAVPPAAVAVAPVAAIAKAVESKDSAGKGKTAAAVAMPDAKDAAAKSKVILPSAPATAPAPVSVTLKAPVVQSPPLAPVPAPASIAAKVQVTPSKVAQAALPPVSGPALLPILPAAVAPLGAGKPAESLAAIVRGKALEIAAAIPAIAAALPPQAANSGVKGPTLAMSPPPISIPSGLPVPTVSILQRTPLAHAGGPPSAASFMSTDSITVTGEGTAAVLGLGGLTPSSSGLAATLTSGGVALSGVSALQSAGGSGGIGVQGTGMIGAAASSRSVKAGVIGGARADGAGAITALTAARAITLPDPVLPNPWTPMSSQQARYCAAVVTAALATLPEGADSQLPRPYTPRQPYATHPAFPTSPSPLFETYAPSIYERFDADTLFFIFFFAQGQYAQYLAAMELKKAGWRFNKRERTWLQRGAQDEPRVVYASGSEHPSLDGGVQVPVAEIGTFLSFDYESGWATRIKRDFAFEYAHLEEDL